MEDKRSLNHINPLGSNQKTKKLQKLNSHRIQSQVLIKLVFELKYEHRNEMIDELNKNSIESNKCL